LEKPSKVPRLKKEPEKVKNVSTEGSETQKKRANVLAP